MNVSIFLEKIVLKFSLLLIVLVISGCNGNDYYYDNDASVEHILYDEFLIEQFPKALSLEGIPYKQNNNRISYSIKYEKNANRLLNELVLRRPSSFVLYDERVLEHFLFLLAQKNIKYEKFNVQKEVFEG
ncbi:MAG: hypothetical protein OEX11_03885 [Nitrosomonas sp.]|nr:hypothetical protein [Nitrosomonas sp.]